MQLSERHLRVNLEDPFVIDRQARDLKDSMPDNTAYTLMSPIRYELEHPRDVRYTQGMAKHTSLYLDQDLLRDAEEVLGTSGPTGTVRAALEDVVRRARLKNLTTWEVELTPADLDALRGQRVEVAE